MKIKYKHPVIRKLLNIALCVLIITAVLYIIYAFYISFTINGVINKAMGDEPYDNSIEHIINKEEYDCLNPRQPELEEGVSVETGRFCTLPLLLPFITDTVNCTFSYTVTDTHTNEIIYGTYSSQFTLKLDYTSFPVYILEAEMAP